VSLLAHIVLDGRSSDEPAVTRALAYVLRSLPCVTGAFLDPLCHNHVDDFNLGHARLDGSVSDGTGRPDLVIRDESGRARVVIENKFWAPLTEHQPVSYLRHLPDDQSGALLFVAPAERIPTLWDELTQRLGNEGFALIDEHEQDDVKSATVGPRGQRVLLITSWTRVLDVLQSAAEKQRRPELLCDLTQLRGLATQHRRRYGMSSASIVWWYGPFATVQESCNWAIEAEIPTACLYMALSGHTVRHIDCTDNRAVRFDNAQPHRDRGFLQLAEAEHDYYLGHVTPTPAGRGGLLSAMNNATTALKSLLLNGNPPDDLYVSVFSSFFATQVEEGDYPAIAPPIDFPLVVAFDPYPPAPDEANWIVVRAPIRAPADCATASDVAQLRADIADLRAAVIGGDDGC